jgi:hypothetical protein
MDESEAAIIPRGTEKGSILEAAAPSLLVLEAVGTHLGESHHNDVPHHHP